MITSIDLKTKLEAVLSLVATLDPKIALAEAGVETLVSLFSGLNDANKLLHDVLAETQANAPEVAKEVIAYVDAQDAAWDASVAANPGT